MVHAGAVIKSVAALSLLIIISSCGSDSKHSTPQTATEKKTGVPVPAFNGDSAFAYVKAQVDFGPRVPNTEGHRRCGNWLAGELKRYCDTVIEQSFKVRAFDGKELNSRNIIGSFNPGLGNRILLAAHWDSRPFADQDKERRDEPIDGANDGASGVGVLLEVARHLASGPDALGVDIIFFDAEDYGQPDDSQLPRMEDSYCLGSQYWARQPHIAGYRARYGVLLDMVGAQYSTFTQEGTSMQYAPEVVDKVWKTASATGYGNYFLFERTKPIIDDHFYINRLASLKCIDIIHYDYNTPSNFWTHWHTHEDTIDKIDRNTLRAVGQTLLELLYREFDV